MLAFQSDDYQVLRLLGRGGAARVYLAREQRTGARVAVKVLEPRLACMRDIVERFHREAAISQRVAHPNLIAIHRALTSSDGAPLLVMEALDGAPLGTARIEPGAVAAIGVQLADALGALHAARFAHCDVKPRNVMVLPDGEVRLIDLGLARDLDRDPADEDCVSGTPAYLSPEQSLGRADDRSDIYALGCVLYQLATGRLPFEGSFAELLEAHRHQRPAPPSRHAALPVELDRLIVRMLAKDPGMRPRIGHVARELDALTPARDVSAPCAA